MVSYSLTKNKDVYTLVPDVDCTFELLYISKYEKTIEADTYLSSSQEKTIDSLVDGQYKIILDKGLFDETEILFFVYNNLQVELSESIESILCSSCLDQNECFKEIGLTTREKLLLKTQSIFNNVMMYQHYYINNFEVSYSIRFANYVAASLELVKNRLQVDINYALESKIFTGKDTSNKSIFDTTLFICWLGFYFIEIDKTNSQNIEEINYIKDKFNYDDITSCVNFCFTVEELEIIFNAPIDIQPPTIPLNLNGVSDEDGNVSLTWDSSLDNYGTPVYELEYTLISDQLWTSATTINKETTSHSMFLENGEYKFRVRAKDQADNYSKYSNIKEIEVSIQVPDLETPSIPLNLQVTKRFDFPNNYFAQWEPATDNIEVAHYILQYTLTSDADWTGSVGQTLTNQTSRSQTIADGTYKFRVKSVDTSDNESGWSNEVTLQLPFVDIEAPTRPNLSVEIDNYDAILTWTASTDNVEVENYEVQNTVLEDPNFTTPSSTVVNGLTHTITYQQNGAYLFRVRAKDIFGNYGDWVFPVRGDIAVDELPPSTPVLTVNIEDNTGVAQWTESTDDVEVQQYSVYATLTSDVDWSDARQTGTSALNANFSSLADGEWKFRVRAKDYTGKYSEWSNIVIKTVAKIPDPVIFYGAVSNSIVVNENLLELIQPNNVPINTSLIMAIQRAVTGNNIDPFVFNWNDASGTNYERNKHFIAIPTTVVLGAVTSDAGVGETYYSPGGSSIYNTSSITFNGENYTIYEYLSIAPVNGNITINTNLS